MTITNSIVAKASVAVVAVAMAFSLVAPAAKAQDVSALSLEQLIALVNQLQSQLSGSSATTGTGYTFTRSLSQGSTGADVMELQKFLNKSADTQVAPAGSAGGPGSETSFYGPATAAAVSKFQTKYSADILVPSGLTSPTGYFGPASIAKANALNAGSTSGNGSTGSTGPISGGAGDLTLKSITSGTETTVGEGQEENVLGIEGEADVNSDIGVTSVRVQVGVHGADVSTRLTRYVDEVKVYLGDEEVGSVDADEFSRSGATSTATINLKGAVIRADEKERLYVAFVASDVIDTDDQDADVLVKVDRVRYTDGTGAILTDDGSDLDTVEVSFEDSSEDNGAKVQSSSNTPEADILKVDENSTSDDYHVFTFRVKGNTDSSDVSITSLPIDIRVINASTTGALDTTNLIDDLWIEVGGDVFDDSDVEADHSVAASGDETVTYTFDIDEGDLVIAGGDTEEVEVWVKFGEQEDKYTTGSKITVSVSGSSFVAEDEDGDSVALSGSATGKQMTVDIAAATVDGFSWNVPSAGNFVDLTFTVEADDEDFTFATSGASFDFATSGTATTTAPVWSIAAGSDGVTTSASGYTVQSGEEATFRVRWPVNGVNGSYLDVTVKSVAGKQVPSDKQVAPTATRNVQS